MGRRVEDELRGSSLRIWWSRTSCWQGACWNLAGPRPSWCLPGSAYLRPSPGGQSARRREEGGTRGGHETGVSGGHWATLTNPQRTHVHVDSRRKSSDRGIIKHLGLNPPQLLPDINPVNGGAETKLRLLKNTCSTSLCLFATHQDLILSWLLLTKCTYSDQWCERFWCCVHVKHPSS